MPLAPDTEDWYGIGQPAAGSTLAAAALSVGTSAVHVAPVAGQMAIAILADKANTGTVYVGTTGSVGATDWPLASGDYLALDTSADLYLIGSLAGQTAHVLQLSS